MIGKGRRRITKELLRAFQSASGFPQRELDNAKIGRCHLRAIERGFGDRGIR